MAANEAHPKVPVEMKKSGFSVEEIEDIIKSKVTALFEGKGIEYNKELQDVITCFQIHETEKGNLDKRRISTEVVRDLLAVSSDESIKGPRALFKDNPDVIGEWQKAKVKDQNELFKLLIDNAILHKDIYSYKDGYLYRDNAQFSEVELCNTLDDLAKHFATFATSMDQLHTLRTLRTLCQKITLRRIYTASVFSDNILDEKIGYNKWRKHLWMVASFAAVVVALDILQRNLGIARSSHTVSNHSAKQRPISCSRCNMFFIGGFICGFMTCVLLDQFIPFPVAIMWEYCLKPRIGTRVRDTQTSC